MKLFTENLTPEEKTYIMHGVEDNIRDDGRSRMQYRPVEVETGVIPSAMGSARVLLGETDVIACVNAEPVTPAWNRPNEGQLAIHVDLFETANPAFEDELGEDMADEITALINKSFENISLKHFCIVPGMKCWKVDIDVTIQAYGGNIYDPISFAIKSALATAAIPRMIPGDEDEGKRELQISDDPFDTWTPDVSEVPVLVTLSKVGDSVLVDATTREEECCSFACILAVSDSGKVLSTIKIGPGSVRPVTFKQVISEAGEVGKTVNSGLMNALQKERHIDKREIHCFLT